MVEQPPAEEDVAERRAFVQTVIYHQRKTSGRDGCTHEGCELVPGDSFSEHLWETFVAKRAQTRVTPPAEDAAPST